MSASEDIIDWEKAPKWASSHGVGGSSYKPVWFNADRYQYVDQSLDTHIWQFRDAHGAEIMCQPVAVTHRLITPLAPTLSQSLSQRYPKYYKPVGELTEVDVYAVHQLFSLDDVSGCIHHASKKLLLSGVRTGGKTKQQDIREARDTLNRWLELNGEGV